jgi:hypothetical protein
MIKKRLPIFIVGAMLGVAFAVVYLQGRHSMREAQKKPIAVKAGIPFQIKVQFNAPWKVISHQQNQMMLVEEGASMRVKRKEWTETEILSGVMTTPSLQEGIPYRIQGFLQACENSDPKRCAPYYADIALLPERPATQTEITLPYLPK